MEKFNFTTTGMQQLQLQLFSLDDPDLAEKAEMIKNDLLKFLDGHFVLSDVQRKFLTQIDKRFLNEAGRECKCFLQRRQLIGFYNNNFVLDNGKPYTKSTLDMEKHSLSSFSFTRGYQISETLNFILNRSNNKGL
ncbi:MAG: hypothetical protein EOO43_00645 [Flavobacterium sp.]|nr:MAG: hypothetical protein EOO43_00645 [Flavobacterium sp.]